MVTPFSEIRQAETEVGEALRAGRMDRAAAIAHLMAAGVERPEAVHYVGLLLKLLGPDPHPERIV
ncbi:MAG TPA: hypothetical protein VGE39_00520 [Prosthecobacter sp.]